MATTCSVSPFLPLCVLHLPFGRDMCFPHFPYLLDTEYYYYLYGTNSWSCYICLCGLGPIIFSRSTLVMSSRRWSHELLKPVKILWTMILHHIVWEILEGEGKFRKDNPPFAFFIWITAAYDFVYHNTSNIQQMMSLGQFFIPQWCFTEGWVDT